MEVRIDIVRFLIQICWITLGAGPKICYEEIPVVVFSWKYVICIVYCMVPSTIFSEFHIALTDVTFFMPMFPLI